MKTENYKHWELLKLKYPDAILLLSNGEYYETFFDDAVIVEKVIFNITMHVGRKAHKPRYSKFKKNNIDKYLPMFVRAGHRVALCDQLENPELKVKKKTKSSNCNLKLKE